MRHSTVSKTSGTRSWTTRTTQQRRTNRRAARSAHCHGTKQNRTGAPSLRASTLQPHVTNAASVPDWTGGVRQILPSYLTPRGRDLPRSSTRWKHMANLPCGGTSARFTSPNQGGSNTTTAAHKSELLSSYRCPWLQHGCGYGRGRASAAPMHRRGSPPLVTHVRTEVDQDMRPLKPPPPLLPRRPTDG